MRGNEDLKGKNWNWGQFLRTLWGPVQPVLRLQHVSNTKFENIPGFLPNLRTCFEDFPGFLKKSSRNKVLKDSSPHVSLGICYNYVCIGLAWFNSAIGRIYCGSVRLVLPSTLFPGRVQLTVLCTLLFWSYYHLFPHSCALLCAFWPFMCIIIIFLSIHYGRYLFAFTSKCCVTKLAMPGDLKSLHTTSW